MINIIREKGYKILSQLEKEARKDQQFQTQTSKKDALRRNLVYNYKINLNV